MTAVSSRGRSHGVDPRGISTRTIPPGRSRAARPRHSRARLRTRFRPLHGNFNPIRNIFRAAGQAASEKRGTAARGKQLANRDRAELREKKNAACGKRGAARWVYAWSTTDPAIGGCVARYRHTLAARCTMTRDRRSSRTIAERRNARCREVRFAAVAVAMTRG